MARSKVKFKLNSSAVRELLRSPAVQADITRRAERVAQQAEAAGIRVEGDPGRIALPIEVSSGPGKNRASAKVTIAHPSGKAVEAKHRLLGRSIDAARG